MVTKVNVSLPRDILEQMDKAAREAQTSRSGFLVQAVKHYLEELEETRARERRRKAGEVIDQIREELGAWDATAEVLKWRQLH